MKYLLDTHLLLWVLEGNAEKLGGYLSLILNEANAIYINTASYWEIAIKETLGKIKIKGDIAKAVEDSGFSWLGI